MKIIVLGASGMLGHVIALYFKKKYPSKIILCSRSKININLIVKKAKEYGKIAGIHNGTTQYAKEMIALGYQFITISSDYRGMTSFNQKIVNEMKEEEKDQKGSTY